MHWFKAALGLDLRERVKRLEGRADTQEEVAQELRDGIETLASGLDRMRNDG